ncbi:ParA family protein [Pseudomonas sp. UMAB-40]|uniref:ParA family protein n=1 Tax=Pseudomonas sp. UMAB-40 TaxID=1365407 RepID=UPI001C593867|nr:ParA family protein [Pseudomonas sp. UMAB-40]
MAAKAQVFDFHLKPLTVCVAANYKGGVGKTVSSRVLVQGLAYFSMFNQGKPILYIDLDPQGNTGLRWNLLEIVNGSILKVPRPHPKLVEDREDVTRTSVCDLWLTLLGQGDSVVPIPYPSNTGEILENMGIIPKDVSQPVGSDLIHIVPNNENQLMDMQSFRTGSAGALEAAKIFRDWLRSPELAEQYSFVVIDTPPTRNSIIDIAIHAATHIYIPFIPEVQSVDGVMAMVSYFQTKISERRESDDLPLTLLGLLPNIVQEQTLVHQQQINRVKNSPLSDYLMSPLRRAIDYPETDNWRNTPDQVFAAKNRNCCVDSTRFVKQAAKKLMEDRNGWERMA